MSTFFVSALVVLLAVFVEKGNVVDGATADNDGATCYFYDSSTDLNYTSYQYYYQITDAQVVSDYCTTNTLDYDDCPFDDLVWSYDGQPQYICLSTNDYCPYCACNDTALFEYVLEPQVYDKYCYKYSCAWTGSIKGWIKSYDGQVNIADSTYDSFACESKNTADPTPSPTPATPAPTFRPTPNPAPTTAIVIETCTDSRNSVTRNVGATWYNTDTNGGCEDLFCVCIAGGDLRCFQSDQDIYNDADALQYFYSSYGYPVSLNCPNDVQFWTRTSSATSCDSTPSCSTYSRCVDDWEYGGSELCIQRCYVEEYFSESSGDYRDLHWDYLHKKRNTTLNGGCDDTLDWCDVYDSLDTVLCSDVSATVYNRDSCGTYRYDDDDGLDDLNVTQYTFNFEVRHSCCIGHKCNNANSSFFDEGGCKGKNKVMKNYYKTLNECYNSKQYALSYYGEQQYCGTTEFIEDVRQCDMYGSQILFTYGCECKALSYLYNSKTVSDTMLLWLESTRSTWYTNINETNTFGANECCEIDFTCNYEKSKMKVKVNTYYITFDLIIYGYPESNWNGYWHRTNIAAELSWRMTYKDVVFKSVQHYVQNGAYQRWWQYNIQYEADTSLTRPEFLFDYNEIFWTVVSVKATINCEKAALETIANLQSGDIDFGENTEITLVADKYTVSTENFEFEDEEELEWWEVYLLLLAVIFVLLVGAYIICACKNIKNDQDSESDEIKSVSR